MLCGHLVSTTNPAFALCYAKFKIKTTKKNQRKTNNNTPVNILFVPRILILV